MKFNTISSQNCYINLKTKNKNAILNTLLIIIIFPLNLAFETCMKMPNSYLSTVDNGFL